MRKWLWIISITVVLVVFIVAGYWFQWDWTGFPAKNLWDWLNLLGVLAIPVVVGFGAVWYTTRQTRASEAVAEQQRKIELEVAEQRRQIELKIAEDNQREAALQSYIDKMSELLLEKNLRQSQKGDEVRNIARTRTLGVLRKLGPGRRRSVLEFLHEAGLINKDKPIIDSLKADLREAKLAWVYLRGVNLSAASLEKADLHRANLSEADLFGTNLDGANLSEANLSEANLSRTLLKGTDFSGANLNNVNLSGADLSEAKGTTDEQLSKAKSLEGATMPDGSKHP